MNRGRKNRNRKSRRRLDAWHRDVLPDVRYVCTSMLSRHTRLSKKMVDCANVRMVLTTIDNYRHAGANLPENYNEALTILLSLGIRVAGVTND